RSVRCIRRHSERQAAAALDLRRDFLDEVDPSSGHDHVRAGVRKSQSERASDTARSTDDDRALACEIEERHQCELARGIWGSLLRSGTGPADYMRGSFARRTSEWV